MNSITEVALAEPPASHAALPRPLAGPTLSHPDAALLFHCAESGRLWNAHHRAVVKWAPLPAESEEKTAAWVRMDKVGKKVTENGETIFATEAATLEGLAAKVDALFRNASHVWDEEWQLAHSGPISRYSFSVAKDARRLLAPSLNPDAELIDLCRQIETLEDEIDKVPGKTIAEERRNKPFKETLLEKQHALIDTISNMTAFTLDGFRARARAIVKYAPDLANGEHGGYDEMMVSALLQDLIAVPGGALKAGGVS